jgi:hypothetical protein
MISAAVHATVARAIKPENMNCGLSLGKMTPATSRFVTITMVTTHPSPIASSARPHHRGSTYPAIKAGTITKGSIRAPKKGIDLYP